MRLRCQILVEYAKWTALSAVRSGAPIKAREPVYRLLDGVAFEEVLDAERGPVSAENFDAWHERQVVALRTQATLDLPAKWREAAQRAGRVPRFPVGWSAKLINVFLKTTAYVGELGREGVRDVLHPPLDGGLRRGFMSHFETRGHSDLVKEVDFGAISAIEDYDRYRRVIASCRVAARSLECSLVEVEQLAGLGLRAREDPPGKLTSRICP